MIVDDAADMLDGQLRHFVRTRHRDGFGVPEYVRALEIIAPNHQDVRQLAYYAADATGFADEGKLEWDCEDDTSVR